MAVVSKVIAISLYELLFLRDHFWIDLIEEQKYGIKLIVARVQGNIKQAACFKTALKH